ncbi:pyruvate kinase [Nematocida sp. LUAm3]|nr:pyruvate kinase [Nematocida sp. LUAm3]KAI5174703.1 pyruvate kinase [Nematocida sp. LUAm2]KAI5177886.1 pyruvate kinase [Nematocida sp. LUAm1]
MQERVTPCKIIATLGPACRSRESIEEMYNEGMRIARMNFSHSTEAEHKEVFDLLNVIRENDAFKGLAIAVDTKGPEIRTGVCPKEVEIKKGDTVVLTTKEEYKEVCSKEGIFITHKGIFDDLTKKPIENIFIDDGKLALIIRSLEREKERIVCEATSDYTLTSRKGINIPGALISLPGITEKDRRDIEFGIENGADYVFASFIRKKDNIEEIRSIKGAETLKIIAKIESQQALDNLDEIIEASDGVMVARGDLGIEVDQDKLFFLQCQITNLCHAKKKPLIVATQMVESMCKNLRPTRAEITDVGFAAATGAGCVMLSGETATGCNPVNAIRTMRTIVDTTSQSFIKNNISISLCGNIQLKEKINIYFSKDIKKIRHMHMFYGAYAVYGDSSKLHLLSIPETYSTDVQDV